MVDNAEFGPVSCLEARLRIISISVSYINWLLIQFPFISYEYGIDF